MRAAPARDSDPAARDTPRLALAGALAVLGLLALDVAAVPAVLPSVRLDLGSSSSGLVWVQDAYLLALAVGLLLLGRLGADHRLLVVAGLACFLGGSLLASAADTTATLVAGRALQGSGAAALLVPAAGSLAVRVPRLCSHPWPGPPCSRWPWPRWPAAPWRRGRAGAGSSGSRRRQPWPACCCSPRGAAVRRARSTPSAPPRSPRAWSSRPRA